MYVVVLFGVDIDLSDKNGNVKNLRETPFHYANEFLSEREKFVLIRVDRHDDGLQYTPLLQDDDFLSDAFLSRLSCKNYNRPSSRRSRGSGKRTPTNRPNVPRSEKDTKSRSKEPNPTNSKSAKPQPRAKSKMK